MPRLALATLLLLAGCQSAPHAPLALAPRVDLDRFMGDWYVIAATPTLIDREAHDAIESYRRDLDGSIATTYTFRDGAADGAPRRYTLRGFVRGDGNAVWGMRFMWPVEADYRISYLAPDYSRVVVAREKRDYAWIMAREPRIAEEVLATLYDFLRAQGYDTSKLRRMPQSAAGGRR